MMAGLDNIIVPDDDDCQIMASDASKKDWCKPLHASMARLDQMQPSVCNMYMQPAGSLKPPKSMTKPLKERNQHCSAKQRNLGTKTLSSGVGGEDDLVPDSTRSLTQAMAWGSSSSIPDLLARQKSQRLERPSSASRYPPRNRPSSAGKSRRPQSAKDALDEKGKVATDLGIKGSKKQMDLRMAGLHRSNSDLGTTSKSVKTEAICSDRSPVKTTTLLKFKEFFENSGDSVKTHDKEEDKLDSKTEQPKSSDDLENMTEEVINPCVRASQEEDRSMTPSMPESIRFSLPNMNDDVDEDNDDELNTDRLLQQAESFMQKKSDREQQVLHNLVEAHATIPNSEIFGDNQICDDHFNNRLTDRDCPISSVAACNSISTFPKDKTSYKNNSSKYNNSTSNFNHSPPPPSPHVTWSDSHTICLFDNGNMPASKAKTIEVKKKEGWNQGIRYGKKTVPGETKTETFKNHKNTQNSENDFLIMPNERHVSYKPLEVSKSDNDRNGLIKSPDHVKSYISDEIDKTNSKLVPCLSQKSSFGGEEKLETGQQPTHKLVPTVTLAYEDENDEDQQVNDNKQHMKKKSRIRKTFDEIETYMSKLDKAEFEKSIQHLTSNNSNKCSCGDISCKELLATNNQQGSLHRPHSASKSRTSLITAEKSPVVKTTKTIEFCDGNALSETVIKNTLVAAYEAKPEKLESLQGSDTLSALKPSIIKRQQATEVKPKLKTTDAKKITPANENLSTTVSHPCQRVFNIASRDGGLAPPQTSHQPENKLEEKSDSGLYEALLEEAKSMALTSLMDAARAPTSVKTVVKTRPKLPHSKTLEGKISDVSKPRPFSAPLKLAGSKACREKATTVSDNLTNNKHKSCQHHSVKGGNYNGISRPQSAKPCGRIVRLDSIVNQVDNSPEMCHAQRMQMKMAAMGVHIDASVLEKALFAPSGKSIHYNVPGNLPKNPTESLIPHYKHWLAEDYRRVKLMERRLARDDEIKYMQKVAADKRALAQSKGKKKKRKEKCLTSAG